MDRRQDESASDLAHATCAGVSSQGVNVSGTVVRLGRFQAVFEITGPDFPLRTSEVLNSFKISLDDKTLYEGKAVVVAIVETGIAAICEVSLPETGLDLSLLEVRLQTTHPGLFNNFLSKWQNAYRVTPEFKLITSDIHTFLLDFRAWTERYELVSGEKSNLRSPGILKSLAVEFTAGFNELHEKFEVIADAIAPDQRAAARNFARRLIQAPFMCSPFGHRACAKPLGYAGDYEMVNMIMRDPFEGQTVFAKLMNYWLLQQYPSVAHRNRITYLKETLIAECSRVSRTKRQARILNLGCGPAQEIVEFLSESAISDHANFLLLDFNDQTITDTGNILESCRRRYNRSTKLALKKKSVLSFIKDAIKAGPVTEPFDLVYCAGLFDYLPDSTCQQLTNEFYRLLAPGGLVVATNVDACKPFRNMLEFALDWYLIYRNPKGMAGVMPTAAPKGEIRLLTDETTVNIFAEARKPVKAT
jgi:extracellular factor (EF) 3-hydroxypalmitic acid methyl ester biosynthesis protein